MTFTAAATVPLMDTDLTMLEYCAVDFPGDDFLVPCSAAAAAALPTSAAAAVAAFANAFGATDAGLGWDSKQQPATTYNTFGLEIMSVDFGAMEADFAPMLGVSPSDDDEEEEDDNASVSSSGDGPSLSLGMACAAAVCARSTAASTATSGTNTTATSSSGGPMRTVRKRARKSVSQTMAEQQRRLTTLSADRARMTSAISETRQVMSSILADVRLIMAARGLKI